MVIFLRKHLGAKSFIMTSLDKAKSFLENEFKLESKTNLQLKYNAIEQSSVFVPRIKALLEILGFYVLSEFEDEVTDEYYDDEQKTIQRNGWSLRIRMSNKNADNRIVTLKSQDKNQTSLAMQRSEFEVECTEQEQIKILLNPAILQKVFGETNIRFPPKLKCNTSVKNCRHIVDFSTKCGSKWRFCYDRFYFFYSDGGMYSPLNSEIEIEKISPVNFDESEVYGLRRALIDLFDLEESKKSKLSRASEFLSSNYPPVVNIMTIGFDIVGYSELPPLQQLDRIQLLNKIAKDAFKEVLKAPVDPIYIPTGDGMFLILEKNHGITLPFVRKVQEIAKESIKNKGKKALKFRTCIHFGPVFRYTDVNEDLNYSGNGINIAARVLGFGAEWHVLCSDQAKEQLCTHGEADSLFHDAQVKTVKHDERVKIFNIYEENEFGNPRSF